MNTAINEKQIVNCIGSAVFATDSQAVITHVNCQSEKKLGMSAEDLIGRRIADALPLFKAVIMESLQSGRSLLNQPLEVGEEHLIMHVTPIYYEQQVVGAVCNLQELDACEVSVMQSDSYRELNRQLKTIIAASSDGIWVCDGEGNVVSINSASEALNGIKSRDIIGKNIIHLLENKSFDQSVTTKVLESGKQETIVQNIKKTNRILLCTGTPARDENGNIAMIVVNERDLTELETLRNRFKENKKLTEKFKEELSEFTLRELVHNTIIADSNIMKQILQKSLKLAHIGASNILILGASGTGKGLLAKSIHKNSNRRDNPFVEINCAALPENLLEAELFGYEKGAFTGAANTGKVGLFELAQGGTLFLDEIGDMPLNLQTKLLKYLDDKKFRRLGGTKSIHVDCATISATNRNLQDRVKSNEFREDLYYRLSSFTLEIPSLRDRREDIPGLVRFYLKKYNQKYGRSTHIRSRTVKSLQSYDFPGNIRELKNIIENGVVLSEESKLDAFLLASIETNELVHPPEDEHSASPQQLDLHATLEQLEKQLLIKARAHCTTTREMAAHLNISQPSVVRKCKKYGL
ncbi:sigma 54-interacting transcriptional regulator [Desulfosediminicola flagellatus]|uniref:sigma 54-interacting transcriptional regulator n=1 Tax=Desulfosediminicola flagellatus TaxID=2569541 RepID=UPI00142EF11F|nr:sigma 54-interacting transcriptional regulator [Desulfosediminicola flagellatus]